MKRLTERDEYGNADIIGVDSEDLQLNLDFDGFNRVTEALNKLAAYEDAEEQGRLVVLPCKVGNDVFLVHENKIYRLRIQGISVSDSGQDILLHFGGYPAAYVWGSEIGRTYFLTREEAEKALEGMG